MKFTNWFKTNSVLVQNPDNTFTLVDVSDVDLPGYNGLITWLGSRVADGRYDQCQQMAERLNAVSREHLGTDFWRPEDGFAKFHRELGIGVINALERGESSCDPWSEMEASWSKKLADRKRWEIIGRAMSGEE